MKIAVIGDGGWGTALACNLIANGHEVIMWGAFPDYLEEMKQKRENVKFLPGVKLPDTLQFTFSPEEAVDKVSIILLVTPTQFLRSVLKQFALLPGISEKIFVNAAKGIEKGSWNRISQIVREELGPVPYVAISGPSHAEEVSRQVPTLVTAASADMACAEVVQKVFMNENFRVYTSSDVTGVELGGALKNVFAVAAGIIDGMKLGDNPKAALMTRAICEMGKLGESLGGEKSTFAGLSGVGDLIVTCCSGHSRNRYVGEELGKGRKLPEILKSMGMTVAEGVTTAQGALALARQVGAETPIIDGINAILEGKCTPQEVIKELMTRAPKKE